MGSLSAPVEPVEEHAPRLHTAMQIRDALPSGSVIELQIEAAGQPTVTERMEFLEATADDVLVHDVTIGPDGAPIAEDSGRARWTELLQHATFPAAATTISEADVTVPIGTFHVRRYVVTGKTDEGKPDVTTYDFAVDLPGPPVRMVETVDGVTVFTMTQTTRTKL